MTAPRKRTPPEKKKLALKRDSFTSSDHYDVGLRRKKKSTTRANRHAVKQALRDPERDTIPKRKEVPLGPGTPKLERALEAKRERRARLEQSPRKNPDARGRRRARRGSSSTPEH